MKKLLLLLSFALAFGQPPSPPAKIKLKVGSEESTVKTLELAPGTYVSLGLSCTGSTCTVTVNGSSSSIPGTVNFSGADHTIVAKTGTAPPSTCSVGEWFFDTDAAAGQNIQLCTATNTWTAVASSASTSMANYSQAFTNQTNVALAHNAGTTDVLVSCYNSSNVEIIPQSITITDSNTVTVAFNSATSGKCVVNLASGGGGGGGGSVYTGTGLIGDGSSGNPIRVDPSGAVASQTYYSTALDFPSISAASCMELNITANGVAAGAAIAPAWPASLPSGLMGMMYGGANIIVVRLCNVTGAAIDPASATFGARVIGGF